MDETALKEQIKQGMVYAMRLLMIAKRSEHDICTRLKDKGYAPDAIDSILSQLKQMRYVDDSQLAKNYVVYAAPGKQLGRRRLSLDLRKKGVSKEIVSGALESLSVSEEKKIAREAALNRYRKLSGMDEQVKKKRIYDFLIRRGFDYGVCRSIVERLTVTDENN